MKAVAYSRISVQGISDSVSLPMQEDRIRAFCLANDYELVGCYSEVMSGGKASNRQQLQHALDEVCRHKGVLVVYSLSRLARSVRDTLDIADKLEKAGANLASLGERIDTSSAVGKMFFRLISSLNEFEKDQLSERTTSAMAHLRRQGRLISPSAPLGFDVASDGRTLVVNKSEQLVIQRIKELRSQGWGYSTIARQFQTEGVKTKAGGKWWGRTVKEILERQLKIAA